MHQWLITKHPHLVAEYIQYDDSKPFQLLQLQYAVNILKTTESMHGKLTTIVRYWLRYNDMLLYLLDWGQMWLSIQLLVLQPSVNGEVL